MAEYFLKNIKVEYHHLIPKIKFKTNFTNCILNVFEKIGYEKTEQDDWDIIWSQKQFINQLYQKRLQPHQRINHFRNFYELCRKDLLVRNIKKHRKTLEKQGKIAESQIYSFCPQTFILPSEYVIFANEFKKQQSLQERKNVWIMKPIGRSQGRGIFLFNKISQVSQWESHSAENYIVQKYIGDPLLIGGKKFDIRIYVLVTSYSPLTVYLYRGGFARFTHSRYDETKITQSQMHLTNVAIQKNSQNYDENLGGKWYLDKLKLYMIQRYGSDKVNGAFYKIQQIIIKTLEALQKTMSSDRNNSFELYGFDVLFDNHLDPWLIEVNGSPSMTANTATDQKLKNGLLQDTILAMNMQKFLTGEEDQVGGFDLICKGKPNKTNHIFVQKVSFLGTYNNRNENLKKLAKNCGSRLNALFAERQLMQKRKLPLNNSNNGQLSKISKRQVSINSRKYVRPMQNNQRDFVIKQKVRRQTNQNQNK